MRHDIAHDSAAAAGVAGSLNLHLVWRVRRRTAFFLPVHRSAARSRLFAGRFYFPAQIERVCVCIKYVQFVGGLRGAGAVYVVRRTCEQSSCMRICIRTLRTRVVLYFMGRPPPLAAEWGAPAFFFCAGLFRRLLRIYFEHNLNTRALLAHAQH